MEEISQAQQPISTEQQLPQNQPPQEQLPKQSSSKWLYGSLALLVIVGLPLTVLSLTHQTNSRQHAAGMAPTIPPLLLQPSTSPTSSAAMQPIPVLSPVTSSNVDQTLNTTDTTMQQSIDQANNDLNQVNSINPAQDNTNGL